VRILDLALGVTVATINHDVRIDWLELNPRASHLLFRDKKRQLHLYHLAKQERTTLLHYCSYVQWVPGADVIVAQVGAHTPNRIPTVNGNTVRSFSTHGQQSAAKGSSTAVSRSDIRLIQYLDSSALGFGPEVALNRLFPYPLITPSHKGERLGGGPSIERRLKRHGGTQNRGNLCVWYSVNDPEKVTHFPIKGEVEDIERERASDRGPGRTEVIVDEGINTVSYALDETLIEFGTKPAHGPASSAPGLHGRQCGRCPSFKEPFLSPRAQP
jgi:hypothetical protein